MLYTETNVFGPRYVNVIDATDFLWIITGPPTHSVGVSIVFLFGVCCRRLSSSVTLHGRPTGGFARAGQAMTSCRLQSNYSSTVALHGGPVVLRPVRATLLKVVCWHCYNKYSVWSHCNWLRIN